MVIGGNKFFRANDSRIRKIACPVLKAVDSGDFKRFFTLFFHLSLAKIKSAAFMSNSRVFQSPNLIQPT